ncbi:MAG: osmoprotectant transport system substrate-binding protein [Micromonosporaceae bacterium]|jgi:osmoprotectant transport system substrate-binding protein|nr:osmoprotectant transport system substrate-binding protein [Micromonosporaceae bacterium]MDT5037726.1 osmoprotectant transport system substrate-binding protein [Micromonosporaceae bacterium]
MRTVRRVALLVAAGLIGVAAVGLGAGCGSSGSSGTKSATQVTGPGCKPVGGQQLVVLTDDKKLQAVDNVIPVVNSKASSAAVLAALARVSVAVGQKQLVALNRATDVERKTPKIAAEEFAAQGKLTEGIAKGSGGKLTVGAANFSENQTLGELYRLVLEAAGYTVTVQQIGNRELYEPALEKGDIQVVPEYAGSLTEFLNKKVNGPSAATVSSGDLDKTVATLTKLAAQVGLTIGEPAAAANQNAFGVSKALADKYHITTLSEFAAKCSGRATVLGGPAECPQRPFCKVGLEKTYNIRFGRFAGLDAGGPQTKAALRGGTITIGLVFSSDSAFATDASG